MNMTCDRITDLLPALAARSLDEATATAVRAHVAGCAECADEWLLVQALRDSAVVAPDGFVDRAAAAVAFRSHGGRSRNRWGVSHLTIAATLAVAMIGGAIAVDQFQRDTARTAPPIVTDSGAAEAAAATAAAAPSATAVYTPVGDPALGSASVVSELTAAQLEALLEEMDS